MKLAPVIASIILASAMLGYGFAQAQSSGSFGTPTTASHPYTQICGDHPCKPGEVYTPGASANATASTSTSSNGTSMSTKVNISENVTATKTTKGTKENSTGNSLATGINVSDNVTATKMTNGTMVSSTMTAKDNMTATVTPAKEMKSPAKQVASGIASADVKCPTGYQLALNKFDKRPACVTAEIYAKLVARGWAS